MKTFRKSWFIAVVSLLLLNGLHSSAQPFFTPSWFFAEELDQRKSFLEYDLPEAKDLCKQFLTLVVAVLVFTLTFSEKIVNFSSASRSVKNILITAWISFIVSIMLCGLGIGELLLSAGKAVYYDRTFRESEQVAIYLIVFSEITFIIGLSAVILDAIIMLRQHHSV